MPPRRGGRKPSSPSRDPIGRGTKERHVVLQLSILQEAEVSILVENSVVEQVNGNDFASCAVLSMSLFDGSTPASGDCAQEMTAARQSKSASAETSRG